MLPRKHDWLDKIIIMKKTHHLLTVVEGELKMLRSVKLSLRPRTSWNYLVKNLCDFLSFEKHLISGVIIRLTFRPSLYDFVVISEHAAKHYKFQIIEKNLYVRKKDDCDWLCSLMDRKNFAKETGHLQLHRSSAKNASRICRNTKLAIRGCFRRRICSKNDCSNEHKWSIFGY